MTVTKATLAAGLATKASTADVATQTLTMHFAAKTAATAADEVIGVAPFAGAVTVAEVVPDAAVTGDNTNTRAFAVTNKGATGAGATAIATLALTTGNNLVAFDAKAMTLNATPSNRNVAAGDVLSLTQTVGAAGLAHGGGTVRVTITRS